MGLIYSPEGVCIAQIRLMKLILRPGQSFAKWPGGDRVGAEKASIDNLQLQSIFQNLSLGRSETPSAYSVAN